MYIDLTWENLNDGDVTLTIYRGDTALDREALPETPVATITDGSTTWRDSTVVLGQTYYYVFVTSNGTDTVISPNYEIVAINRRGAGPQEVIDGNYNLGYMGVMTSGQVMTTNELLSALGIEETVSVTNPFPGWHKFVRNNKIILVPNKPLLTGLDFTYLYNNGLVYGMEGESTNPFISGVAQNKTVTIGNDTYRVRLMTGTLDGNYTTFDNIQQDCEFNDFCYPLAHSVMDNQKLNNIFVNGQYITDFFVAGKYVMMQELASATQFTARGYITSATPTLDNAGNNAPWYGYRSIPTITAVAATNVIWWPVLELVEA